MRTLSLAFLIAFLIGGLGACSILRDSPSSARLATMYATLKVTDGDPARADRVEAIATDVRGRLTDVKPITVRLIVKHIRAQVNWASLDAADTLLIDALLTQIEAELETRLGIDVLSEESRVAVDTVALWVIEAARLT